MLSKITKQNKYFTERGKLVISIKINEMHIFKTFFFNNVLLITIMCSLGACNLFNTCKSQPISLIKVEISYMPWDVQFPIAINGLDFYNFELTKSIYTEDLVLLESFQKEIKKTISTESIGKYLPDVRVICKLFYSDCSSDEIIFDRQKNVYYKSEMYNRSFQLYQILEVLIKEGVKKE